MSTDRAPIGVCNDMDSMVRKLWWGAKPNAKGFLALKAWNDIPKPKKLGGLGIPSFKDINSALLAKLGWKLVSGANFFLTEILKAKYLRGKSFFEARKTSSSSMVW